MYGSGSGNDALLRYSINLLQKEMWSVKIHVSDEEDHGALAPIIQNFVHEAILKRPFVILVLAFAWFVVSRQNKIFSFDMNLVVDAVISLLG